MRILTFALCASMLAPPVAAQTTADSTPSTRQRQERILSFADTLRKAVKIGLLRFARKAGRPGDWEWDEPELVDGFHPPGPDGGLLFVVRVPSLVRARSSTASPPATNPDVDFTACVEDALMEALLDGGANLSLKDHEWVTIVATDDRMATASAVARYTLYLAAKGSDLARMREQKLSREGARQFVVVRRDRDER